LEPHFPVLEAHRTPTPAEAHTTRCQTLLFGPDMAFSPSLWTHGKDTFAVL